MFERPHPDDDRVGAPCGQQAVRSAASSRRAYGPAMSDALDLVVIGTGGAAMAAGIHGRSEGRSVTLVERGVVGGTCLNVGCVPSKALLAASGQRELALHNPFAGAPTSAGPADLGSVVAQKDELVARLRTAKYLDVADAHGIDVRQGEATFTSPTCCWSTACHCPPVPTSSPPAPSRQPQTSRASLPWTGSPPPPRWS